MERFHTSTGESLTGREEIAASILVEYVRRILEKDEKFSTIYVSRARKEPHNTIDIVCNGNPVKINWGE
jgi:hypothetical protein